VNVGELTINLDGYPTARQQAVGEDIEEQSHVTPPCMT
jgi:hypothetical protein